MTTEPAATRSILVVDDSALMRSVVRSHLREERHDVVEAADGAAAIAACRTRIPDVILLDVEMPVLDGFATLAALQRDERVAEVPVVLLSGRTDASDVAEGLRLGAHDYLRKPFEAAELVARVRAAMRTRVLQDELRRRNAELERLATRDGLTGIGNRHWLEEEAERVLARLRRHGGPVSVMLLDLDRFKSINDEHGHAAGDAVLVAVAEALRRTVRTEDLLARWGGEELLVVAPDTSGDGAAALAERMRAAVAGLAVDVGEATPLGVTASVGWACTAPADGGARSWRELIPSADAALYEAKAAGRDTVRGRPGG